MIFEHFVCFSSQKAKAFLIASETLFLIVVENQKIFEMLKNLNTLYGLAQSF